VKREPHSRGEKKEATRTVGRGGGRGNNWGIPGRVNLLGEMRKTPTARLMKSEEKPGGDMHLSKSDIKIT